jgi:phosphoribosylamine--glycine ligase
MAARGTPYSGVLYAGLMLTAEGPQLIEYNCRFGDPECQVLMMRLEDDLVDLMEAVATGKLAGRAPPRLAPETALTVVMAAKGYPGKVEPGAPITLPEADNAPGAMIFHAGTSLRDGALVAAGGRVLNVTATGPTIGAARDEAYALLDRVDFDGGFYRRDIGWRGIARADPQT